VLFAYIPGVKSQVDVPPGFYRVTFDERRSVAHLADDNRRVVGDLSLEVTDATGAGQGGVQVIARFPRPGLGDDCGALCYDRCFPVEVGGGTVPPIPPPTSASPFPTAPPVTGLRSSVVEPSDTVDPYKIISKSCIDVVREAELAGI